MATDSDTLDGKTVAEAVGNLAAIIEGDMEMDSEVIEEAKELGLNDKQRRVAERFAGEGRMEVHDSTIPNLAEKLAAGAELPWTFVLDRVEFVMKACGGMGKSGGSEWVWTEDGYRFRFFRWDDQRDEIEISHVDSKGGGPDE